MEDKITELLDFFKALSDANRLKIIGLLSQDEYSVEELAEILLLRPSTVSHHLAKLTQVGLVSARPESYYNIYRLETKNLEEMSQRLLARETLPAVTANIDLEAYDRKVIETFCDDQGRIKQFPAQQKKFEAILRFVAREFKPNHRYSEKQVNEILSAFSDDVASLRRGLIEYKIMAREGGGDEYWLLE